MAFPVGRTLNLGNHADLDAFLAVANAGAPLAANRAPAAVRFGPDFHIKDEHVQAVVQAVGSSLLSLRLGSSDTGDGVWITDAAVRSIVERCPNLQELELSACTNVSDSALLAVLGGLPQLRKLHCTGHDKSSGKLTSKALDPLIKSNALPGLQELYITDQWGIKYEQVQRLLRKRKQLRVQAGETDSDSAAWGCVLRATGANYGDGLFGRW